MAEEDTASSPPVPEQAAPLPRPWWVALYLAAATLGYSLGIFCFYYWGKGWFEYFGADYCASWRWAAAAAGAILIACATACLNHETKWLTRALRFTHAATAGGWPWQTVKGWWLPFLVTIPIAAIFPLVVFHNTYFVSTLPLGFERVLDSLLGTCRGVLRAYSDQLLFPLLAVYGAANGRAWVAWIGRYLAGGYWCFLLFLLSLCLIFGWPTFFGTIVPVPSLSSIAVPVLLLLLGGAAGLLWLDFAPCIAATPLTPAPPPSDSSPWRTRDAVVLIVLQPLAMFVLSIAWPYISRLSSFRDGGLPWPNVFLFAVAVGIAVRRGRLGDLLLGPHPARIGRREASRIAFLWTLGFLPVMTLLDPSWLTTFCAEVFVPSTSWQVILLSVVLGPIGEELVFRGVLYEYWTRSFGASRACVLTSLAFMAIHSAYIDSSLFPPATIVYYLIMSFALTLLRVRTGAVLPCILAHAGINYFASF